MWISELQTQNPVTAAFLAACAERDLRRLRELNEEDNTGYSPTPVTQHRGRRWSAADAYLRPAVRRPNLTVLTGALVERVDLAGDRATGVTYRDLTGAVHQLAARREVVLAAGSVNSPQILMLSGIGPADALRAVGIEPRHELPGVGEHLQDHLVAGLNAHCSQPVTLFGAESPGQIIRFLALHKGMLSSNVAEAVAFIRSAPELTAPDLELIFAPSAFLDHGQTAPPGHGISIGAILLQPNSSGRVRLASANPADPPSIDPGYLSDDADLRRLVYGLQVAGELLATKAMSGYVGGPMAPWTGALDDDSLAEHVRAHAETLYHPVGTCRMGSDDQSVVDCQLRVRGIGGLRVADVSVMPRINRGHTQAPAYLIGERAAEMLGQ